MKLSEVKKVLELGPIVLKGSKRPPFRFRASILSRLSGETGHLRLFVEESERFVSGFTCLGEEVEMFCGSAAVFWERIQGKSENEVIGELMKDIEQSFPIGETPEFYVQEIVKTYEFDLTDESVNEDTLRIRVEILRRPSSPPVYTTQTFFLRYYDVVPTFPVDGLSSPVSVGIYVLDNHPSLCGITGESIEAVTKKLMIAGRCLSGPPE